MFVMPVAAAWVVSTSDSASEPLAWLSLLGGYAAGIIGAGIVLALGRGFPARIAGRMAPQELPAVPPLFLGREHQLAEVVDYLRTGSAGRRLVMISGPPGIGKTAFALHVAHQMATTFPDGQLFATLDARERDASEVVQSTLIRFLIALGHGADQLPTGLDACRQAFEHVSASKRLLVLLDDVNGVDPRPLIPAGPRSATIITARNELPGLEPNMSQALHPLSDTDAVKLLAHIVGENRVKESQGAATEIAQACAGVPLALQMAGQALVARPSADMSVVVSRTTDSNVARPDSLEWALDVSYRLLTSRDRAAVLSLGRLSRRFQPWMLAQEANLNEDEARSLADRLSATQFVERWTTDAAGITVYETVENVQDYARLRAGTDHPAEQRRQVRDPLDEQRIHTFDLLDKGLLVAADIKIRESLVAAHNEKKPLQIGKALAALAELRAELGGTDEVVDLADDAWQYDDPEIRARVYRVMGHIQRRVRQLDVAERNLIRAERYAVQADDTPEQIRILTELALVHRLSGRPDQALVHTDRAMTLAKTRRDGGKRYRSRILLAEGMTRTELRQWDQAAQTFAAARVAAQAAEFALWRYWVDYREAQLYWRSGENEQARKLALEALAGFTGIRHRYGSGHCRLLLGRLHADAMQLAPARTMIEDALETFRNCGDRFIEGHAAAELTSVHLAEGSLREAAIALRRAKQLKTGQRYWRTSLRLATARARQIVGLSAARQTETVTTTRPAKV